MFGMGSIAKRVLVYFLALQVSGAPPVFAQTMSFAASILLNDDPCQLSGVQIRGNSTYLKLLNTLELEHKHLNKAFLQLMRLTATPGTLDVGDAPPLETVQKIRKAERCLEEFRENTELALANAKVGFSNKDDVLAGQFMMISGYFTRFMQLIQVRVQMRAQLKHLLNNGKISISIGQSEIANLSVANAWRNNWDLKVPAAMLEHMTGFHDTHRVFGNKEQLKAIVDGKNQSIRIDPTSLDEAIAQQGKVRMELSPSWVSRVEKSEPTYYLSEKTFIQTAKLVLAQALLEQQAEITMFRRENTGKSLKLPPEIIREIPTLEEIDDFNQDAEKISLEPVHRDGLIDAFDFTPLVTEKEKPKFNRLDAEQEKQLQQRHEKHEARKIAFITDGFMLGLIKHILPEYYKDLGVGEISQEIAKPESAQFAEWFKKQTRFLSYQEHLGLSEKLTELIRTYPLSFAQMSDRAREEELRKIIAVAKLKAITPIVNSMIDESNKSRQGTASKPPPVPKEIFEKVDDYLNWYARKWSKELPDDFIMNWDKGGEDKTKSTASNSQNKVTIAKELVRESMIEEITEASLVLNHELNSDPGELPLQLETLKKALQGHINNQAFQSLTLRYLDIIWSQASYSLASDAFKAALGLLKKNQSPDAVKFSELGALLGWHKNWSAGASPRLRDIPLNQNRGILSSFGQKGGLTGDYFQAYRAKALATPLLTVPVGSGGGPLYKSIVTLKKSGRESEIPQYVDKGLTYLYNQSQKDINQVARIQRVQDLEVVLTKSPLFHRAMNEVYPMFQEYVELLAFEEKYRPTLEVMRRPFWEKWAEQNFYPGMLFLGTMGSRGLMAFGGWALRPLKFTPKLSNVPKALRAGANAVGRFERAFLPFTMGYQWAMMVPMGFQMAASWKQVGVKEQQLKTVEDFFYASASSGGIFDYLELMEAEGEVAAKKWAFAQQAVLVGAFFGIPLFYHSSKRIIGRMQDRRLEQAMNTIGATESRLSLKDPAAIEARVKQKLDQIENNTSLDANEKLHEKVQVVRAQKTLTKASQRLRKMEANFKARYENQMDTLGVDSLDLAKARDNADNIIQEASQVIDDVKSTPQQVRAAKKAQANAQHAYEEISMGAQIFLAETNPGLFERTIFKIKQWRGKEASLYEPNWTRWERYFETFSPPMDKRGMGFGASAEDLSHIAVGDYTVDGRNPYDILGLKPGDTPDDIRTAYRRLARKYHPDVNPNDPSAEDKFKEIGAAYDILNDSLRRTTLDLLIRKKIVQ